jgi:hypothetical protein
MPSLSDADLVALIAAHILANQKTGTISPDAIDEATTTAVSIVKSAKAAVAKDRPKPKPTGAYKRTSIHA